MDSAVRFGNTDPLDSELSVGYRYRRIGQPGPGLSDIRLAPILTTVPTIGTLLSGSEDTGLQPSNPDQVVVTSTSQSLFLCFESRS